MKPGDTLTFNKRRYRLDERIASGAYGEVWAATDPDGRPVAIKFVNVDQMTGVDPSVGPRWREHLEREIDFLKKLSDDETAHIVKLLGHGEVNGQPALVLERMETNLSRWLERSPQTPSPRQTLDWARQIVTGLEIVHAHRLVYRDLKLSNVLVGDNGRRLKLADFGTLKPQRDEGTLSYAGTPMAMAPEQRLPARYQDGRPVYDVDWRADYYALGLILFALFTGGRTIASQVGHEGAHREGQGLGGLNDAEKGQLKREVRARIVGKTTFGGPRQDSLESLALALYEQITKLLEPRKEDRPESTDRIRETLDAALAALPAESTPACPSPPLPEKRLAAKSPAPSFPSAEEHLGKETANLTRRRWIIPLIGMVMLASAVLGLGYYWWTRPDTSPPVDTSSPLVGLATPKTEPLPAPAPEPTPSPAEPAPSPAEPTPSPAEPAPSPAQPTPPTAQPTPPTAQPTPPTAEPTPSPTVDRPLPKPVPPPVKPSPAPGPVATKPAPALPEPAPTPTQPSSALVPAATKPAPSTVVDRPPPPAPSTLTDPLGGGRSAPTLARVAGGTLVLPGVDGQSGRSITIQPFALALQPVTFADYDLFARQTDRSPPYDGGLRPEERAIHPVTSITWYEAQAYVEWLSQRTGQRYRLPSEAEWLYARQKGVGNRDGIGREWVADCASNGPTALPRHQAPRGQEDGGDCGRRVLRGESASNGEPQSTDRGGLDIGFRVARELNPAETRP
ncbi:MAG: bifunctional serine/threonine-protein kinase/formylglycine-generating enzyme family protein [Candidatus Contendobacter sp.]|nr:bifunctional serine/threonine-protein kinase/formylglycine-generating enzyme family protein [Candidatus Contendobacter sp.]